MLIDVTISTINDKHEKDFYLKQWRLINYLKNGFAQQVANFLVEVAKGEA